MGLREERNGLAEAASESLYKKEKHNPTTHQLLIPLSKVLLPFRGLLQHCQKKKKYYLATSNLSFLRAVGNGSL